MFEGNKPEQKFKINEKVKILGWTRNAFGIVEDIQWIYHSRLNQHTWGYKIKYIDSSPLFSFIYVPEGYLRGENEVYPVHYEPYIDENDNNKVKEKITYSNGSYLIKEY
jgi:hypothetical protein